MTGDSLLGRLDGLLKRISRRKAARQIWYANPVSTLYILVDHNRVLHRIHSGVFKLLDRGVGVGGIGGQDALR